MVTWRVNGRSRTGLARLPMISTLNTGQLVMPRDDPCAALSHTENDDRQYW